MAVIEEIQFEEMLAGLKEGRLTYLDVRNRSELDTDGRVVGSVVVPLPEVEEAFMLDAGAFLAKYGFAKPGKEARDVVVTCRSGRRAVAAIEILRSQGYQSLKLYKGSFLEWVERGGPVVKG